MAPSNEPFYHILWFVCYNEFMILKTKTALILPDKDAKRFSSEYTVLDIETSGRYFRNSRITSLSLIRKEKEEVCLFVRSLENEEDEVELLAGLGKDLNGTILTYNGSSFDLPFLRNKLRAYGLSDPLPYHRFLDLMPYGKSLSKLLGLSSYRLDEFRRYLGLVDACDTEVTLHLLGLLPYLKIFYADIGDFDLTDALDHIEFRIPLPEPVPDPLTFRDEPVSLHYEDGTASLCVLKTKDKVPRYFPDPENYIYLKNEGYAVHKSVGRLVNVKDRAPADRKTACLYVDTALLLQKNKERQDSYLSSLLDFIRLPLSLPELPPN